MASHQHQITIGILAIQGAFLEHEQMLKLLSHESILIECVCVRTLKDLVIVKKEEATATLGVIEEEREKDEKQLERLSYQWLDALILPGGESTTMTTLLEKERYVIDENDGSSISLLEVLRHLICVHRLPVWGTCAGAILLAEHVTHTKQGGQAILGGLNVAVERNAYGSQLDSFQTQLAIRGISNSDQLFPAVFIRAPAIRDVLTEGIEVLAEWKDPIAPDSRPSIVAVRQDMILATTFHPELTKDTRMHDYFLQMVSLRAKQQDAGEEGTKEMAPCLLTKVIKTLKPPTLES